MVGTLDERRNLPEPGQLRGFDRLAEAVRSGTWRRELVREFLAHAGVSPSAYEAKKTDTQ